MPRARIMQTSFTGGALSPALFGRVDLPAYYKAAATLENVLIQPQGGVKRRPGLRYIGGTHSNLANRLVPYNYKGQNRYLLSFTPGRVDIFENDTLLTAYTSGALSSLTADIIAQMNYTQDDEKLILVHHDLQPMEIKRDSGGVWSFPAVTFTNIPTHNFGSGPEASISASRGWPGTAGFYQGRLVLGGLKSRPQTLLFSKVDSSTDLDIGTGLDDEGIDVTIADDRLNEIKHLFPGRALQVFTSEGEFTVEGDSFGVITPSSITIPKATLHGSGNVRPQSVDGATLFLESGGKALREFVFKDVEQTYTAQDVSILSSHLLSSPVDMALRRSTATESANYLFVVNEGGSAAVLNILRNQGLSAWSSISTLGTLENVAVVEEGVYFTVNRTVNSTTVRYVEKLDEDYLLDASELSTSGSPTTSWSGFGHLSGETVKVIGDGDMLDDETVSAGNFTSSSAVNEVEAGLDFTFSITTLPAELPGNTPESGEHKRLVSCNIRLYESREVVMKAPVTATSNGTTYAPGFTISGQALAADNLYTGWKKIFLSGATPDAQLTITQQNPLEAHVMAYTLEVG